MLHLFTFRSNFILCHLKFLIKSGMILYSIFHTQAIYNAVITWNCLCWLHFTRHLLLADFHFLGLAQSQEQENVWPPPPQLEIDWTGRVRTWNQTPPPPPRTWKFRWTTFKTDMGYNMTPPPPTSDLEAQVARKLWDPITLLVIWWCFFASHC